LLQVELDQIQTDERSQHSEELFVDKDTLRRRARAPSPWHSTLVPRHESGLRHNVFNRLLALQNSITRPSALVEVPFALGMPRIPERAYLALARAMVIQALDTVLASPVSQHDIVSFSQATACRQILWSDGPWTGTGREIF